MTDREELVKILGEIPGIAWSPSARGIVADHLLANGVEFFNAEDEKVLKTAERNAREAYGDLRYLQGVKFGVESAAKNRRWIPVTERLPEEFVSVLVHIPSYAPMPTVREAYHVDDCWVTKIVIFHDDDITHWMPLPEPPKEEA